MMTTGKSERAAAAVLAAMAGLGLAVDVFHIVTFHGRGSPDVASVLLLMVIAALHLGVAGANGGLAAVLARRRLSGVARVAVWAWLGLSGGAALLLSLFSALLAS